MPGNVIRRYERGDLVFYNKGSTHRPGSIDGAEIFYIPFDGIIFGKDHEDLARKMIKIGTTPEALEYALMWMVPEKRQKLI